MSKVEFVGLCILDGWGHRKDIENNAVKLASTPHFDRCWMDWPHSYLRTDGQEVGLPEGQFGNSEVGHMNLGAGRVVWQDLPRINQAVAEKSIATDATFRTFLDMVRQGSGRVHLLGLVSPGGVHAHQDHIAHLAGLLSDHGVKTDVHAFLDGRDTPPQSAHGYILKFADQLRGHENANLATICGRYYSMDRDNRWERTSKAFDMITLGEGERVDDFLPAIQRSYDNGINDEFVEPHLSVDYVPLSPGDAIVCANFRADRCRQILSALVEPEFDGFDRGDFKPVDFAMGMTSYSASLDLRLLTLFPVRELNKMLGQVVSEAGLPQTRMAETEKYPHVTFFFNGGREEPFEGEKRILIPSPKVATYDLQPEMSARDLTDAMIDNDQKSGFLLINFANPDMVGHTGDLKAAVRAVETVDECLGRIVEVVRKLGGALIVTADHGNCEVMVDPATGQPHTAHTTNLVPFIIVGVDPAHQLSNGRLADVAPTVLQLLGIQQPPEMTGRSLLSGARL